MKWRQVATIVGLAASLAIVLQAQQGGGRTGGAAPAGTGGALIGGTLAPARPDARGWGCQVKASINAATPRPFYNKAKELLFQDKQITNYTIATYNPEFYCEVAKHCDCIWFEMQHSTMSYDEVCRMILACPGVGAAPMIPMPDALESSIQKATDLGAIGNNDLSSFSAWAQNDPRYQDALVKVHDAALKYGRYFGMMQRSTSTSLLSSQQPRRALSS